MLGKLPVPGRPAKLDLYLFLSDTKDNTKKEKVISLIFSVVSLYWLQVIKR